MSARAGQQDVRLTEAERTQLNRLLSDPTYFPVEFRAWLKSYIEGSDIRLPLSTITGGIPAPTPPVWIPAGALSNSWVAAAAPDAPHYRRVGDRLELKGQIASGTMANVAFIVPVGYRPPTNVAVVVFSYNGSANIYGVLLVNTAGQVIPSAPGSNVAFRLEASIPL